MVRSLRSSSPASPRGPRPPATPRFFPPRSGTAGASVPATPRGRSVQKLGTTARDTTGATALHPEETRARPEGNLLNAEANASSPGGFWESPLSPRRCGRVSATAGGSGIDVASPPTSLTTTTRRSAAPMILHTGLISASRATAWGNGPRHSRGHQLHDQQTSLLASNPRAYLFGSFGQQNKRFFSDRVTNNDLFGVQTSTSSTKQRGRAVVPTLQEALDMPSEWSEMPWPQLLQHCGESGDHGANEERLIRNIMATDCVDHASAQEKMLEIESATLKGFLPF